MNNAIKVNVGIAQFAYTDAAVETNLQKGIGYMAEAAAKGMDIVLLPEMFTTGFPVGKNMDDYSEPIQGGKVIQAVAAAAKSYQIAVVGSIPEWDAEQQKSYNTSFFIDRKGEILKTYRKVHLFDKERNYVHPGRELSVVDYEGVRYGLLICFDLEFPEPARYLAQSGAQVLLVVSNNMHPYGKLHRIFAQARAIENHMFVAYCNRTGNNSVFTYEGESCLVSPKGEIVAQLDQQEETLLSGVMDLKLIDDSRKVYNYLQESLINFKP